MPRRGAAHAEEMRERILEGGRRAFISGGFRGTSVPSIAAEAGVSVGLIYRYFPSKEELFLELCISGTPRELTHLAERIAPIDDPVERLTVAIDSYFDALFHAIGAPLVLQALAAAPCDGRIREALRRRGDDLRGFAAAFTADALRRGEVDPATDIDEVAATTTMLLDGALVAVAEQGDLLDRDAVRDRVVRTVVAASGLHLAARQHRGVNDPVATTVVIPVRTFEGAKSRLGAVLDAEERRDLVERLLKRTVAAALATPGVTDVLVVSPDPEILAVASTAGARPLLQLSRGLNPALQEARAAIRADRLLVLPADIPAVTAADLVAVLAAGDAAGTPSVVVAPDRHGRGTNALLLAPPDVIDPAFGGDSRAAHAWLACSADAAFAEVPGVLALDIDTAEDLLLAEAQRTESPGVR